MPHQARWMQRMLSVLELWFGFSRSVSRGTYLVSGLSLATFKYTVEAIGITWVTKSWYSPLDFINPVLSVRLGNLNAVPEWLPWVLAAWTIPFIWIAVNMSVRRASDAGISPWNGFHVLLPAVNFPVMAMFCYLPTKAADAWQMEHHVGRPDGDIRHAMIAIGTGVLIGGCLFALSILVLKDYGLSMFLVTPFVMGSATGFVCNSGRTCSWASTVGLAAFSILCGELTLFLFALEGVVCLIIALPLLVVLGILGGVMGKAIAEATQRRARDVLATVIAVPLSMVIETWLPGPPERSVVTAIEISATIDTVWRNVTSFSKITAAPDWYFHLGIACPMEARIEGEGVGAIRYCEFTTGAFVEPITESL